MIRHSTSGPAAHLSPWRLLHEDPAYRHFMFWQMLQGFVAMMTLPVVVLILTDVLKADYGAETMGLATMPLLVSMLAMPVVGRLFDTIGVTRFRATQATFAATYHGLLLAAVLTRCWTAVLVAFAVLGLAQAVGNVAFNIAHTRFAPPHRGQLYMGVHLQLQGIRGMTAPFLGICLYGIPGVGIRLLLIAAIVQCIAAAGFFFTKPPEPGN